MKGRAESEMWGKGKEGDEGEGQRREYNR